MTLFHSLFISDEFVVKYMILLVQFSLPLNEAHNSSGYTCIFPVYHHILQCYGYHLVNLYVIMYLAYRSDYCSCIIL